MKVKKTKKTEPECYGTGRKEPVVHLARTYASDISALV